jgi:hypothetical protein
MNVAELQEKLIAAARAQPPSDAVPYAFEKRVLARLPARGLVDRWTLWAVNLWRAAAPCLAVMIVVSACAFWLNHHNNANDTQAADLESTVYAGLDNLGEAW